MNVTSEKDGPVTILELSRGKGNALSDAFVGELRAAVARAREEGPGCLVMTSADERFFSVGMDLVEMQAADPGAVSRTLQSFCALYHEIFFFPRPVLAVLPGHALAGGAILALAADFRIGRQGNWQFGVTEVDLGVPVPPGVYEMTVQAAGVAAARRILLLGETFDPASAWQIGLLDRLEPTDRFESAWREFAAGLAAKPVEAYSGMKLAARVPLGSAFVDKAALQAFMTCWFAEPARNRRREIYEKLTAKKPG